MKRIYDPEFRYVPSHETDIRKTFERLRRRQRVNAAEAKEKVAQLPRKVATK
jgi:hypothetical protein